MSVEKGLALALSGGGARGLAHIGLLKALEELKITVGVISGCSAGAAIGALYAKGMSSMEISRFIKGTRFFHFRDLSLRARKGLLSMNSNRKLLKKALANTTFEDLRIPLHVVAADLLAGRPVYFSSGELISPVLASSAIPGIFEPLDLNGTLYIDGGALSCFPVEPLIGDPLKIIGMYVNPVPPIEKINGISRIFDRTIHLSLYHEVAEKSVHCHHVLEPPELVNYSLFDFEKHDEIVQIGYDYAMTHKENILSAQF